jgi:hypothetical protein
MLSDRRIVMKGGEVISVLIPGDAEKEALATIRGIDEALFDVRERIKAGEVIEAGSI